MQLPSVKQLQYLVAVNETQHFGKAAERCFVTQSALSTGIRELEALLGVKLLERSRKQVSTTIIGESIVEQARKTLRDLGQIIELAEHNNKPLSGPVRIGIIPTITPFILPTLLPKLRGEFSDIEFYLSEQLSSTLLQQLSNGEIDVLMLATPYDLDGVKTRPLFKDKLMLAHHKDTKLIDPESWEPNETDFESLMLLEEGHCLRNHAISSLFKPGKHQPPTVFNASSLSTLIHMIDSDLGFSLLPEMAKDSHLVQSAGIQLTPLPEESYREIALVWREKSIRDSDYEAISKFIQSVFTND